MNVTLCEGCFPEWGGYEVLTIVPIMPCEACGKHDNRREPGGAVVHLFRGDPRKREMPSFTELCAWLAHLKCNSAHLGRDSEQACNYMTAAQWIDENFLEQFNDCDPEDIAAMKEANTIWSLQIYPDTPIGSYTFYGATMQRVLEQAYAQREEVTGKNEQL